ncbi:type II toxin-antitoxin system RelE/ParE family toxin [Bosea sp. 124]|uniref:type II toxin-antitoxin system RelE/ParE family toxin n=1 Tax=Bosea sp. 124 TaxID=2135642 RepID=UPI000D39B95E|nr:type II toxin-antitoxin system RelE/ParE family toxin [Bosea sp. 124]PTM40481.1 plasmid stabilization system protein ParE [Bosea sp. 124]
MKVHWSSRALAEIDTIFAFVAAADRALAERLTFEIEARAAKMAEYPEMGRPGRVDGTREFVVTGTPYIIPYRVRDGRVEILAALHASREWPDHL